MMRDVRRVLGVLLFLVSASALRLYAQETPRPNFLIVFTDDQGYRDVGCFGSPDIATPRLDRMAAEGMRFTHFYAQPICGPSRAALMTGCYPMRVAERGNVKDVHPALHAEEITIAELLKPLGYATAMIGKWDLAGHTNVDYRRDLLPNDQGFDLHFGTPSSNDNWARTVLLRDGQVIENPISQSVTTTRRYTDEAIDFIQTHRDEPFFVYLAHTMPHVALHVSPDFKGVSENGVYGDVIQEIDHEVGRLLDELTALDLADNTYVLFFSDNGPWLSKGPLGGSALPLRGGKVSTWEGGVRVPCIMWAPGRIPSGSECDAPSATIDILPTLARLAGTEPPEDRVIDGRDIRPLLRGDFDLAEPERVLCFYLRTHLQAVRQGQWKLHLARPDHPAWLAPFAINRHIAPEDDIGMPEPMLFDLQADPSERRDISKEHPDVVARLLALAEAARDDIGDYDRIGAAQRFFDESPRRPDAAKWIR